MSRDDLKALRADTNKLAGLSNQLWPIAFKFGDDAKNQTDRQAGYELADRLNFVQGAAENMARTITLVLHGAVVL